MKKLLLLSIFVFIICLISVLVIIGFEYFVGDNMFLAVLVEGIIVFISVWFLLKFSGENYFAVIFLYSLFFILFETGVYTICETLGFIDFGMRDLISWRLLYNSIFCFIWIPLSTFGIKSNDKILMFFYFLLSLCLHLVFNLIMQVVS